MTHPHDVAVDSTDHMVYVGELNPRKVWKFQMSKKMFEGKWENYRLNQFILVQTRPKKLPTKQ